MRTRYKAATILAAAAIIGSTAGPASASTGGTVHYYANDVAGTGRFGPAITGSAAEGIAILAARYERDPATFAQVAAFAGFGLPGGTGYLLAHRDQWQAEVGKFYAFMRATIREEETWTSPYRTEYAQPHGNEPTTFGWTSMPDLTRSVLVFTLGRSGDAVRGAAVHPGEADTAAIAARQVQARGRVRVGAGLHAVPERDETVPRSRHRRHVPLPAERPGHRHHDSYHDYDGDHHDNGHVRGVPEAQEARQEGQDVQ
jgi:hypothetical protein